MTNAKTEHSRPGCVGEWASRPILSTLAHGMASQVSGRMPGPPVARAFCPPPFFAMLG